MDKRDLVVKDNKLVRAYYSLTLQQTRFILFCITKLRRDGGMDDDFKVSITVKEFADMFPEISSKNSYSVLKSLTSEMFDSHVKIKEADKLRKVHWLSEEVYYFDGEGRIDVYFNSRMMKYLHGLSEYTSYDIRNIGKFTTPYTVRVFELISQYKDKSSLELTLEEFSEMLCLEGKYSEFRYLNRDVLKPVIKDLAHSKYNVSMESIKEGRKVVGIRFVYGIKTKEEQMVNQRAIDIQKVSDLKGDKEGDFWVWDIDGVEYRWQEKSPVIKDSLGEIHEIDKPNKVAAKRKVFELVRNA